jgi:hypothetical protein
MKLDIKIGCEVMDWIKLAQHRLQWWNPVKTMMNFTVSENTENFLTQ